MAKLFDTKAIAAAISTAESDVGVPSRAVAGSMTSMIAALAIGECVSKAVPVDPAITIVDFNQQGSTLREQLRNRITPSVTQAKARTHGHYTIELGTLVTTGNNLYLVAVVTRTE